MLSNSSSWCLQKIGSNTIIYVSLQTHCVTVAPPPQQSWKQPYKEGYLKKLPKVDSAYQMHLQNAC